MTNEKVNVEERPAVEYWFVAGIGYCAVPANPTDLPEGSYKVTKEEYDEAHRRADEARLQAWRQQKAGK